MSTIRRVKFADVLPRHSALTLLCAVAVGCQAAAPSPATVEIGAALPTRAEPGAPVARRAAAKVRPPCKPRHPRFPCNVLNTYDCEPSGITTKERECWVKLILPTDLGRSYDSPCFLLDRADEIEQVAAMEADRAQSIQLTTPGLAEAVQGHVDAEMERVRAARALAKAVQDGKETSIVTEARASVDAATALERRRWAEILRVCDPY